MRTGSSGPNGPSGSRTRVRRARRVALLVGVLAISALGLTACIPAGGEGYRNVSYQVVSDGPIGSDLEQFRTMAFLVFNDHANWRGAGINFIEVPAGWQSDFTLVLANEFEVPKYAPGTCDTVYSCTNGRFVVINDTRYQHGSWFWPGTIEDYRTMVLNHELGHWLGLGHAFCPATGEPAPIMQQQSINLQGCAPNPRPLPWELDSVR